MLRIECVETKMKQNQQYPQVDLLILVEEANFNRRLNQLDQAELTHLLKLLVAECAVLKASVKGAANE
jgi:hypothetical protein